MNGYRNRGNGNSGSWGRGNTPSAPATVTVFITGKRMAMVNAYNDNRGDRKAAVHFCEVGKIPEALEEMGETRIFGIQSERTFGSVAEGLAAAAEWLEGKNPTGDVL